MEGTGILVMAGMVLLFLSLILIPYYKELNAVKLQPFELEFYKRCQRAGLGDTVKTKEAIQQAGEIAQTLASEKSFLRKIKKRHLKARWLNKRLKNGKCLFAQETEARQEAERKQREAEAAQRRAVAAQQRAEEERRRAVAERTRLFNAFPHSWVSYNHWEYVLGLDRIEKFDREKKEHRFLQISQLDEVKIQNVVNSRLNIEVSSNYSVICLYPEISYEISSKGGNHPTDEQMLAIYSYLVKYSAMPEEAKARLLSKPNDLVGECTRYYSDLERERFARSVANSIVYGSGKSKDASVVGRAAAGWAIAGPAGGVIGALSAVNKNNKNRNK